MIARFGQFILLCAAMVAAPASANVREEWCLDSATAEIYTVRPDGAREALVLTENVVADGGETIPPAETSRIFDEGLAEAMDGADALNTSLAADAWETVIETIYGHDAFGQRIKVIGEETANDAGDRCRTLQSPGFAAMFGAFIGSFGF